MVLLLLVQKLKSDIAMVEDYLSYLLFMIKKTKKKKYANEFGYVVKQLNAMGYVISKNNDCISVREYGSKN